MFSPTEPSILLLAEEISFEAMASCCSVARRPAAELSSVVLCAIAVNVFCADSKGPLTCRYVRKDRPAATMITKRTSPATRLRTSTILRLRLGDLTNVFLSDETDPEAREPDGGCLTRWL